MADRIYFYIPGKGVVSNAGESERQSGIPVHGTTLAQLRAGNLTDPVARQEAKKLLRTLMGVHLGDRVFVSRAWYDSY